MGKKKSVVLMVLLTIVIAALCLITAFPAFAVPGTVKKWNPAVKQYDFGADLSGGYYAYYYPKGVISEAEFNDLTAEDQEDYKLVGGLYMSKDEDDNVLDADGNVTSEFKTAFKAATDEICNRYAKKQYSDFKVSVYNDYVLKVELPAYEMSKNQNDSSSYVNQVITLFALTDELTIAEGETTVDELKENEIDDLIKSVSLDTEYEVVYLSVKFTSLGKDMVKDFVDTASSSDSSSTAATALNLKMGDNTVLSVNTSYITENNNIRYPLANESEIRHAETLEILLNSALKGGFDVQFADVTTSEIRSFDSVYGDNATLFLYITILVAMVGMAAFAIVKAGRYGVVNLYTMLSYFIVTALCFAFITEGVFEVSLGTAFVFLAGLALTNVLNAYVYSAIKTEFNLGKTVESSVKGGYKKTLLGIVDIYAVLLLGGIALLIGGAGLHTFAAQALICIVTGAFINLLWARVINYIFLSASKDKYKYFRFVREEDDDDE